MIYFSKWRYQENGHTKGVPEFEPPKPIRLQWNLDPALEAIEKSYEVNYFYIFFLVSSLTVVLLLF